MNLWPSPCKGDALPTELSARNIPMNRTFYGSRWIAHVSTRIGKPPASPSATMGAMKIALLGATGFVGRSAAADLAARPEVRELLLVDYDIRKAKRLAKSLSPRCRWAMSDVGRAADLGRLLPGIDAVASAVGPCAEYEKPILLTCAASGTPAASIGDGPLSAEDLREIDGAFRRGGAAAVSGCGMLPGWTDLLEAHAPRGGTAAGAGAADRKPLRYFFCSPDRFGGYAFFRRIVRGPGTPAPSPPPAMRGAWFETGPGEAFGIPGGRPSALYRRFAGTGPLGAVGRELSAAILFWLRRFLGTGEDTPAAAAGIIDPSPPGGRVLSVRDPGGRLAGVLLAETAVRLALGRGAGTGLLPLPEVVGREDAERIAARCGAEITAD